MGWKSSKTHGALARQAERLAARRAKRSDAVVASEHDEQEISDRPRFVAVDFFCGAGGTTRGLIDAGGYVVAGVDKEDKCRRTYVENNRNERGDKAEPAFLDRDIFTRSDEHPEGEQEELAKELSALLESAKKRFPGVPVLFAICAPCQPFTTLSRSAMNARRVEKRKRDSSLLSAALEFVREHQPDLVLSENVAGIQDARFGPIWADFEAELRLLGFATGTRTVCVSAFGVAQRRKRSILLAAKKDQVLENRFADLLEAELTVPTEDAAAERMTVQKVIGHLPKLKAGDSDDAIPNHRTRSLSDLNIKRIGSAKPGETNKYLHSTEHGDLSLPCHRRVNARLASRGFNDVYTRMRGDGPSPTITTHCHSISNGRFGHYDIGQNRGISLREAAALQSFQDDYVFHPVERIESVARMIGNAVPPKLARFFAGYLADLLRA